ncbi:MULTISPECIES: DUF5675 family protein [Sphingobacterium]|nr:MULTISPECIES: DUF5675 family protein [Sphingobacterium]QQT43649.1 hypothetical protein I6J00_18100 [Sphingobacterium multivorum]SUI97756.1 Uncharacterised protein [Sphingobacterium multivorum]HCX58048.1 hypothetical protein [Sphingobacterium sp.]
MELTLKRVRQGNNSTLSELYINGRFQCYGLEDTVRDVKIKGRTAIPAGTYTLGLNRGGGMNTAYKKRFPDMHQGMIEIRTIPNFSLVYIHIGNTHEDTEGCLLVGTYFHKSNDDWGVYQSADAYKQLYGTIIEQVKIGQVTLKIENKLSH